MIWEGSPWSPARLGNMTVEEIDRAFGGRTTVPLFLRPDEMIATLARDAELSVQETTRRLLRCELERRDEG